MTSNVEAIDADGPTRFRSVDGTIEFFCLGCPATVRVAMPVGLSALLEHSDAFIRDHDSHGTTPAAPELES